MMQPENGLLIKNFYDDEKDTELRGMLPFLKFLSDVYDVRNIEEWKVKFSSNKSFQYQNMNKIIKTYQPNVSSPSKYSHQKSISENKLNGIDQNLIKSFTYNLVQNNSMIISNSISRTKLIY